MSLILSRYAVFSKSFSVSDMGEQDPMHNLASWKPKAKKLSAAATALNEKSLGSGMLYEELLLNEKNKNEYYKYRCYPTREEDRKKLSSDILNGYECIAAQLKDIFERPSEAEKSVGVTGV